MGQQEPRGQSDRARAHNLTAGEWGWEETEQCCGWSNLYLCKTQHLLRPVGWGIALMTLTSADPNLATESSCIPSQVHSKGLL